MLFFSLFCHTSHTLVVMCHPSMCTNEWRSIASTLCPLSLPCQKSQEVSCSYAQNKAQKDHPQKISWVLMAISNETLIVLWHWAD